MAGKYKVKAEKLTEKDLRSIETNLDNGDLTITQAYGVCRKMPMETKRVREVIRSEVGTQHKTRCTHINRMLLDEPSIKIGGAVSIGQCENEALPYMVVCEGHCEKTAMTFLIQKLCKVLKQLGD